MAATTTKTMATPLSLLSLLLLLPLLSTTLLCRHAILSPLASASASPSPLRCRSGWTDSPRLRTVPPSRIDDGYCDCPYDGLDEPTTGACSGSIDGMWAGLSAGEGGGAGTGGGGGGSGGATFACPQQPSLVLPPSRLRDGICDCCDGADEVPGTCEDVCDVALAEERAARAKAREAFAIGSKRRTEGVAEYWRWRVESEGKLKKLKEESKEAEEEEGAAEDRWKAARVAFARRWIYSVRRDLLGSEAPKAFLAGGFSSSPRELGSFVVSLCRLSAEASPNNVANGRCRALDRASLDLGVLWDDASDGDGDALPHFSNLDETSEEALADFAERIESRLEGKDDGRDGPRSARPRRGRGGRDPPPPPPEDEDDSEDPYGDDWHDHPDYHHLDDDHVDYDYDEDVEEDYVPKKGRDPPKPKEEAPKRPEATEEELLVRSILDGVPLDRTSFKERAGAVLKRLKDDDAKEDEPGDEEEEEADEEAEGGAGAAAIDPMARRMVESTLTKRISGASRGEDVAEPSARRVASLLRSRGASPDFMTNLAVATLYHAQVSSEEVAALMHESSDASGATESSSSSSSCAASWAALCAAAGDEPRHPSPSAAEAARRACARREGADGARPAEGGAEEEESVPAAVPDGYRGYFEPRPRGPDDVLATHFAEADALHKGGPPGELSETKERKEAAAKRRKEASKAVSDLERELGEGDGGVPKYGLDGELYALRDTCHKVEAGKYEYEVCLFGKAWQRDVGKKGGGTDLGNFEKEEIGPDGRRVLRWGGGAKCWNGPVRSAEVEVTCGAETKVLTADEPETCRYALTMESPIGCDDGFKAKNSL
ncbi:hypothetical protein ACHAWF_004367 [Thalassiosira exigua]